MLRSALGYAWKVFRSGAGLNILAVTCLAVGCASFMAMLTVLHVLQGDPIPAVSAHLFYPHMNPLDAEWHPGNGPDPTNSLSYIDALALKQFSGQKYFTLSAGVSARFQPSASLSPFFESGHGVSADFFSMLSVPFTYGTGWTRGDDEKRSRFIVLGPSLNRRLFQGTNSVGKVVSMSGHDYTVIGVISDWSPEPRFYADYGSRSFGHMDAFFLPFEDVLADKLGTSNNVSCSRGDDHSLTAEGCTWINYWTYLPSAADVDGFTRQLDAYVSKQLSVSRFHVKERPVLYPLMKWLDRENLVPNDIRVLARLALLFYIVCLWAITGLLLSKFLNMSREMAIRRALGAMRRQIFFRLVAEALIISVVGSLVSIMATWLATIVIKQSPDDYAHLVEPDMFILALTIILSVLGCMAAALLPAFLVCRIQPVRFINAN